MFVGLILFIGLRVGVAHKNDYCGLVHVAQEVECVRKSGCEKSECEYSRCTGLVLKSGKGGLTCVEAREIAKEQNLPIHAFSGANWMEFFGPSLFKDLPVIPGASLKAIGTKGNSVTDLLNLGVRFFDFELNQWFTQARFLKTTLYSHVGEIAKFVETHPLESVIVHLRGRLGADAAGTLGHVINQAEGRILTHGLGQTPETVLINLTVQRAAGKVIFLMDPSVHSAMVRDSKTSICQSNSPCFEVSGDKLVSVCSLKSAWTLDGAKKDLKKCTSAKNHQPDFIREIRLDFRPVLGNSASQLVEYFAQTFPSQKNPMGVVVMDDVATSGILHKMVDKIRAASKGEAATNHSTSALLMPDN